jgi:hypothetical protein
MTTEQDSAPPEPAAAPEPAPQPTSNFDPRRRLRELLSVPERDRSDAQWDEINELEIQLAPGNRAPPGTIPGAPGGGNSRPPFPQGQNPKKNRPPKDKMGGGGGGGKNRRPRKPQTPQQ